MKIKNIKIESIEEYIKLFDDEKIDEVFNLLDIKQINEIIRKRKKKNIIVNQSDDKNL